MDTNILNDDFKKIYQNALNNLSKYNRTFLTSDILLLEMFNTLGTTTRYILSEYDVTKNELLIEIEKIIIISKNNSTASLIDELFQYAINQNKDQPNYKITDTDIFLSFLRFKNCIANFILERIGIDTSDALEEINQLLNGDKTYEATINNDAFEFVDNITTLVKENKVNPFFGRENYINRINEILCRKTKNNPLLIGNAGVGKTSLVEGLAMYYYKNNPSINILSLNLTSVLSGSKYRGDFEKKLNEVINLLKNNSNYILFIDEIHNIISTGNSEGSLDCANILKPILTKGEIRIIGATTLEEYYKYFEGDKALNRRFQNVFIKEPSIDDTKQILLNIKAVYEDYHNTKISDKIINYIVDQTHHKIINRSFPDKAIDVLDDALTINKIKQKRYVTYKDIDDSISKILGIEQKESYNFKYKELEKYHDELNIQNDRNNICVINYNGTKNDLNNLKNDILNGFSITNEMMLEIDLNNYNESFFLTSLIGSPKGYVGYNDGGLIYEHIIKNPMSLIIFYNIENCIYEIKKFVINLTSNKKVMDQKNRTIDLSKTIFVIQNDTNNIGKSIGFNNTNKKSLNQIKYDLSLNN